MSTFTADMDPKELIERAKKGDERAFAVLYEHYATPLYRYIYFRVGRKEEAEDLLQTVFLKAYRSLPKFRDLGKNPLTFFYTVARNSIIDYQRKNKEIFLENFEELAQRLPDEGPDTTDLIADRTDSARIREAIQKISPDQRDVVILRFMNDLSTGEISQLIGKTEESVRQLQSRGLKALRHELQRR